jgi:Ca2+-binding RTX toxin-like protein
MVMTCINASEGNDTLNGGLGNDALIRGGLEAMTITGRRFRQ